jgi:hypothetical protein
MSRIALRPFAALLEHLKHGGPAQIPQRPIYTCRLYTYRLYTCRLYTCRLCLRDRAERHEVFVCFNLLEQLGLIAALDAAPSAVPTVRDARSLNGTEPPAPESGWNSPHRCARRRA